MALERLRLDEDKKESSAKELVALFREEFLGAGKLDGEARVKLFKGIINSIDSMRGGFDLSEIAMELAYNVSTPRYFNYDVQVQPKFKKYVDSDNFVALGLLADEFCYDGERVVHNTLDDSLKYKTVFNLLKLRNDLADFVGVPKCDEGCDRVVVAFEDRKQLEIFCA
ncbi:hypothetical protein UT300012_21530 [Paraclostridium bifermentans]